MHGCGKVVLEGHIKHCVRDGIEHGDADKIIENFTKAVERFSNMDWSRLKIKQNSEVHGDTHSTSLFLGSLVFRLFQFPFSGLGKA